jgi:hypothetical protein
MKVRVHIALSISLVTLWLSAGSAQQQGGFAQLPLGSRVQGSADHGGIQPNYEISAEDPDLKQFLGKVRKMLKGGWFRFSDRNQWKDIQRISQWVREALPDGDYDSKPYRDLLRAHRERGENIPLGRYISCGAGVCRENALLLHLALNEAKIKNYYVYARVQQGDGTPEDHAIVVVPEGNQLRIVDSYNENFDGQDLHHILATSKSFEASSFAKVLQINSYPIYWTPGSCALLF